MSDATTVETVDTTADAAAAATADYEMTSPIDDVEVKTNAATDGSANDGDGDKPTRSRSGSIEDAVAMPKPKRVRCGCGNPHCGMNGGDDDSGDESLTDEQKEQRRLKRETREREQRERESIQEANRSRLMAAIAEARQAVVDDATNELLTQQNDPIKGCIELCVKNVYKKIWRDNHSTTFGYKMRIEEGDKIVPTSADIEKMRLEIQTRLPGSVVTVLRPTLTRQHIQAKIIAEYEIVVVWGKTPASGDVDYKKPDGGDGDDGEGNGGMQCGVQ